MKEIINSVVVRYGTFNISYSVLVFGATPTVLVRFTDSFPDDSSLQTFIKNLRRSPGASLDKALDEVKKVLQSSPRPHARKVGNVGYL